MIDYDKLKLAHELSKKYEYQLTITAYLYSNDDSMYGLSTLGCSEKTFDTIDDLINKLKELTPIEYRNKSLVA